jgi:hypothetical protein
VPLFRPWRSLVRIQIFRRTPHQALPNAPEPADSEPLRTLRRRSACSSHNDVAVTPYLQETITFLLLTNEVAVALAPPNAELGA